MSRRAGQKLGILLASAPTDGDFPVVESGIARALEHGDDVAIFLMDAGVGYALDARLAALLAAGVEVSLCAMDAEARGIDCGRAQAAGVLLGSQHDHARLVRDSDQFLSFT
jgi:sulfur relay (sulfurtransferase) complex TusBCD TusD component (DsrE family)